eukprot:2837005-Alexandrium_andersonii.AAC.1
MPCCDDISILRVVRKEAVDVFGRYVAHFLRAGLPASRGRLGIHFLSHPCWAAGGAGCHGATAAGPRVAARAGHAGYCTRLPRHGV